MFRNRLKRVVPAFALAALVGCAATWVKPNPGPNDCGVRYYRAKPYLLVQSAGTLSNNTGFGQAQLYKLSLESLPDYSEEFSIHMTPGLGFNKTSITFDDHGYGTLKSLNVETDAKTADILKAVAELLPVVLPPGGGGNSFGVQGGGHTWAKCEVSGYNVPVGYYEAVLNLGPDGKKRLFGWRYIGFAPFAQCPIEGVGDSSAPCAESELYGLVTVGNCMVFRRLSEIAKDCKTECPALVPSKQVTPAAPAAPAALANPTVQAAGFASGR